jgi:ribosome biogenesis GTPase A
LEGIVGGEGIGMNWFVNVCTRNGKSNGKNLQMKKRFYATSNRNQRIRLEKSIVGNQKVRMDPNAPIAVDKWGRADLTPTKAEKQWGYKLFMQPISPLVSANSPEKIPELVSAIPEVNVPFQNQVQKVAFAGRSNVGKSSLLNELMSLKKREKLFETSSTPVLWISSPPYCRDELKLWTSFLLPIFVAL